MANIKLEYAEVPEFMTIAEQLVKKFPNVFANVDCTLIQCVAIMNKQRKEGAARWKVTPVTMPIRMNCPYAYYVTIFNDDWAELDESHRQGLIAEVMMAVNTEEEGKTIKQDANYYNVMLRTFGPDYMDDPKLPNMLKDTIKWVI